MNSMEAILGMISRCVGLRRSCDGRVAAVPMAMPLYALDSERARPKRWQIWQRPSDRPG